MVCWGLRLVRRVRIDWMVESSRGNSGSSDQTHLPASSRWKDSVALPLS